MQSRGAGRQTRNISPFGQSRQQNLGPSVRHAFSWNSYIGNVNRSFLPQFNDYLKLIADVHPNCIRQIKTGQIASPKAHSSSGVKILKYSIVQRKYGHKLL